MLKDLPSYIIMGNKHTQQIIQNTQFSKSYKFIFTIVLLYSCILQDTVNSLHLPPIF